MGVAGILQERGRITPAAFCKPRRSKRTRDGSRGIYQNKDRCQSSTAARRMARWRSLAPLNTRTSRRGTLRMSTCIDRCIRIGKAMSGNDQVGGVAKPFACPLNRSRPNWSFCQSNAILRPDRKPDVVGINPPLGAESRGCHPIVQETSSDAPAPVAGRDEQLRDFLVIQIRPRRQVARRAERAEHQEHCQFCFSTRSCVCSSAVLGLSRRPGK